MRNIKTLGAILAISGLALGESDESLIKSVELTTYRGSPAVQVTADLTAPSVSTNKYVIEYKTDLNSEYWTTDNQTISSNSLNRTFVNQPSKAFYRLRRVN